MGRSEEELRIEAVRRRLAGESPERIARSLGRSRRWVWKWVARHEPASAEWAAGRKPGRAVNRTDAALEAQVIAVRRRLAENPWAQVGSDAIAWELSKLEIEAPCTRTVERILARAGMVRERRRERPCRARGRGMRERWPGMSEERASAPAPTRFGNASPLAARQ